MDEITTMAFLLTILAGLSTGIGSLIALFLKDNKNTNYLAFAMSFAAGVMLFVSFAEIYPHAIEELEEVYVQRAAVSGDTSEDPGHFGHILATICFFIGMGIVWLIEKLVPGHDHKQHDLEKDINGMPIDKNKLMRIGVLSAVALALHNFPEGIATFTASMNDINLGITIAIAIALHNIPEGIAVSMPIYYATGSKSKAFFYSFLSGLVEPLGAFAVYMVFGTQMQEEGSILMPAMLAGVAGIMVFISVEQLLPTSKEYGQNKLSTYGLICGMIIMAMSLLIVPHSH